MWARVSTIDGTPEHVGDGVRTADDIPLDLRGMEGALLLVDRQTGRSLTITLWQDQESLQASEAQADRVRERLAESFGSRSQPRVERFEVAKFGLARNGAIEEVSAATTMQRG